MGGGMYVHMYSNVTVDLYRALSSETTTVLRPFFRDHPGEPVPEEKLVSWSLTSLFSTNMAISETSQKRTSGLYGAREDEERQTH